jgi:cytochrome c-type biogenesis protein
VTQFLSETLPKLISDLSALGYLLVFLGGILTSLGPCNLSMAPVLIGYVSGHPELTRRRGFWLSTAFTLGSSLTFVLLGVIAASVGMLFGTEAKALKWAVALVCFVIGMNLLGAFEINLDVISRFRPTRWARTGLVGAFLLGLIIGLVGSQCGTPVLVIILGVAMGKGKLAYGASLLFAYALGRGVPIIAAGTFTGVLTALPAMARWTAWMQKAAGVIVIGVGLYYIWIA